MTNRYVTEAEKEGTRRRMARYRERMKTNDRRPHSVTATEQEIDRLRDVLRVWREEDPRHMDAGQVAAARQLKPM